MTEAGGSAPENERFRSWLNQAQIVPRVAVIAGSGMGGIADGLEIVARAPRSALLEVAGAEVAGHAGEVLAGNLSGVDCVFFLGRFHLYQGLSP